MGEPTATSSVVRVVASTAFALAASACTKATTNTESDTEPQPAAEPVSRPHAAHSASSSVAAGGPSSSTKPFDVPQLAPLDPLSGPEVEGVPQWEVTRPETCIYRLWETYTEIIGDDLVTGHVLLVTYEATVRMSVDTNVAYTVQVQHVRGVGRRDTYSVKLDSDRPADLRRVTGGADTTLLFDMVMPFALLGHPVTVVVDNDGGLVSVDGGEAVRAEMLALHPPRPRRSPHHQGRVDTLLSDDRLATYLVPLAGVTPLSEPVSRVRDEADYAVQVLTNARAGPAGARYIWEEKQAFGPVDAPSKVPRKAGAATIALAEGRASRTVEQEPGRACFRQAGSSDVRTQRWTGVIDEDEVTLDRKESRIRLWVRSERSSRLSP